MEGTIGATAIGAGTALAVAHHVCTGLTSTGATSTTNGICSASARGSAGLSEALDFGAVTAAANDGALLATGPDN